MYSTAPADWTIYIYIYIYVCVCVCVCAYVRVCACVCVCENNYISKSFIDEQKTEIYF